MLKPQKEPSGLLPTDRSLGPVLRCLRLPSPWLCAFHSVQGSVHATFLLLYYLHLWYLPQAAWGGRKGQEAQGDGLLTYLDYVCSGLGVQVTSVICSLSLARDAHWLHMRTRRDGIHTVDLLWTAQSGDWLLLSSLIISAFVFHSYHLPGFPPTSHSCIDCINEEFFNDSTPYELIIYLPLPHLPTCLLTCMAVCFVLPYYGLKPEHWLYCWSASLAHCLVYFLDVALVFTVGNFNVSQYIFEWCSCIMLLTMCSIYSLILTYIAFL